MESKKENTGRISLDAKIEKLDNELGDKNKSELQKYILGLMFYRFLSIQLEQHINNLLTDDNLNYIEAWEDNEYKDDIVEELLSNLGYVIEPQFLWSNFIEIIKKDCYDNEFLSKALTSFNDYVLMGESKKVFFDIFSNLILTSSYIGGDERERSSYISNLMCKIENLDIETKYLGDFFELVYNYYSLLVGKNKAGDFYTSPSISKLIAKLSSWDTNSEKTIQRVRDLYDPACGSSSLLVSVSKELPNVFFFRGQDISVSATNFSKMNLLIHGTNYKQIDIHWSKEGTLKNPCNEHMNMNFDLIVSDFQFSQKWGSEKEHARDERFNGYPCIVTGGNSDFAFLQHMIYLLSEQGKMIVHCPHGVLFRGEKEGEIRKYLVKKNRIETIISLPEKITTKNSPSTCIIVFNKCKKTEDILFINASQFYTKEKSLNLLSDESINTIFNLYCNRDDTTKLVKKVYLDEIENNDFNLNIPRYVDTFEEEPEVDIEFILNEIENLEKEREMLDKQIKAFLEELKVGKYGKNKQ